MPHDIFISYAHVDNSPSFPSPKGWVDVFVAELKNRLARKLGRQDAYDLWMDYELRGNESVTPKINKALDNSRFLVMFLSPAYLASDWCCKEFERFQNRAEVNEECLFIVKVNPVDQAPNSLNDYLGYQFWRNDEDGIPRIIGDPQPDPAEREYYHRIDKLANDLAQKIKATRTQARTTKPEDKPNNKVVYINAGADDLTKARQAAQTLQQSGWSTRLPIEASDGFNPAQIRASELRRQREDSIADSDLVLTLYCQGPVTQTRAYVDAWTTARRRGKTQAPLHLCQSAKDKMALGISDPAMHVQQVQEPCVADCVAELLERQA